MISVENLYRLGHITPTLGQSLLDGLPPIVKHHQLPYNILVGNILRLFLLLLLGGSVHLEHRIVLFVDVKGYKHIGTAKNSDHLPRLYL